MNTYLSRLCSLAFVVLALSACGGGGGSGSSSNPGGTSSAKTKPTTITVIDGYIQGAIVCVDKNTNGSCDAGETRGETDRNGKVTLDIPLEDVGKYPIVAYVPATAIDLDTGEEVGTAFTLKAPKDEHSFVTPLTTLVVQKIERDSTGNTTTAQAKQLVSDSTGISLGFLMSDVTQNVDQTPRTLGRTLAAIQKNRLSELDKVSSCKAAYKNDVIQAALNNGMSSIKSTSNGITACSTANDQKTDVCAVSINSKATNFVAATNSLSTKTLLQSLASNKCSADLLPTSTITDASSGTPVSNGGRTDSLAITLTGIYTAALGNDYSVHVLDSGTDVGTATKNDTDKTWSLSLSSVTPGKHDYKAVVVRNSDSLQGTSSGAYTINVGNSVGATSGSNVLDTITLTLSNLWSNVKSVVFTFSGDSGDLKDGQTSKTLTAPNSGLWSSITTAFKTTGNKLITLVFKDQAGVTLDSTSINVEVATGTVSQRASITDVQDDSSQPFVSVPEGADTSDTTPVISGTVDMALDKFYEVAVYDRGTRLPGQPTYTNGKKDWTFTPTSALSPGQHLFTASVVRFDGRLGLSSASRSAIVPTASPSFTPSSPKVGDTVTFSLSNAYSGITSVDWNFGDGSAVQSSTVSNGATSIQKSYGTQGNKTVTITYKNVSGAVLAIDTLPVSVGAGSVSQTASITGVSDGRGN